MAAQGWGRRLRWPWRWATAVQEQRSSGLKEVAYWAAEWQACTRRLHAYVATHGLDYDPSHLDELRRATRIAERRYWRAVEAYMRQREQTRRALAHLRCLFPAPRGSRAA
jgi:hypothetical protein